MCSILKKIYTKSNTKLYKLRDIKNENKHKPIIERKSIMMKKITKKAVPK